MKRGGYGFALLEALLLTLGLAVLIGIGWYVVRSDKNSDTEGSMPISTNAKKIVAVGDIVCDPDDSHISGEDPQHCQAAKTAALASSLKPDAVLVLGDLQYEDGVLAKFQSQYQKQWGQLKSITYPTPGNHEYNTPDAAGYFDYFSSAQAGERGKGYYSFEFGDWHFVSLNSNCHGVGGCGEGSPQLEWLKQDLQKNKQACTAAFWHHPRFTSGKYFLDKLMQELSVGFWTELVKHKADIVLSGHDHLYERFAPQTASGKKQSDAVRQFTVGTGGRSFYGQKASAINSEIVIDNKFGVLVMELEQKAYRWQFVSIDNEILDSGQQQCSGTL